MRSINQLPSKILVVSSSFPSSPDDSSNAGIFVLDVVKILKSKGIEVEVVSPHKTSGFDFPHHKILRPSKEKSLSHHNPKKLKSKLDLVITLIMGTVKIWQLNINNNQRFDLVLAFWAVPSGLMSIFTTRFLRIPLFTWVLGSDVWKIQEYPLGKQFLRIVFKHSSKIFSDGIGLKREANRYTNSEIRFLPSARIRPMKLNEKAKEIDTKYLISVGRLHQNKGMDLLVQAYGLASKKLECLPNLKIFGEGPERENLQKQIDELDLHRKITLCGNLTKSNFEKELTSAELVIIPSRIESIPLILGDVVSRNCRFLCTNVGDMGEIVNKYNAGKAVNPTPSDLSQGLIENLASPDVYSEGRKNLADELNIESSVETILQYYVKNNSNSEQRIYD